MGEISMSDLLRFITGFTTLHVFP